MSDRPSRSTSAHVVSWRRRIRTALTERLALKGTAIFLALALWVVTSTREETEELVPVRFAPELDRALVIRGRPPEVRALVRGLGREMLKLRQDPPVIRRTIAGDLPDTVTLELRAGDVDLPPGIDARVLGVRPRTVTLVFEPIVQRAVPVRAGIVVTPDSGGRVAVALWFSPDSVTVVGRRRSIARITAVRTRDDTLPSVEGYTRTVALDTTGFATLGVRVRPASVRVRVQRLAPASAAFDDDLTRPRVARRASPAGPRLHPAPPPTTTASGTQAPASPPAPAATTPGVVPGARRDTTRPAPTVTPPRDTTVRRPPAARDTTARRPSAARDSARRDSIARAGAGGP